MTRQEATKMFELEWADSSHSVAAQKIIDLILEGVQYALSISKHPAGFYELDDVHDYVDEKIENISQSDWNITHSKNM